jgi:hypothetical protein
MPRLSRTARHRGWTAIGSETQTIRTVTTAHARIFCVPRSAPTSQHLHGTAPHSELRLGVFVIVIVGVRPCRPPIRRTRMESRH